VELSGMKNNFTEDGPLRLERAQKELTLESLEKKYAKEIAAANRIKENKFTSAWPTNSPS
jgi:hypothetical protein